MKILLAIKPSKPKHLADNALRWCGRLGYQMRVFVPKKRQLVKYAEEIAEVNYQYYLALGVDILTVHKDPKQYAKENGYDLLLSVPAELKAWRKGTAFKDTEIIWPRGAVGLARIEFGKKPKKRIKRWSNGCTMERV